MKKQNMNNKGFSLVELIIVIAIMAILIVVLAPQYLRYVERSRNSTDMQNARTIMTAVETWAADPQAGSSFGAAGQTVTFNINAKGTASTITEPTAPVPANTTPGEDALTETGLAIGNIACESKTNWSSYTITGTVQDNGAIAWSFTSADGDGGTDNFGNAMTGN